MSPEKISSLLVDERNVYVWNKVNGRFHVKFERSDKNEYSVFSIGDDVTFYIPKDDYCQDSFTHELLHGLIYYYGCPIGGGFKNVIGCNSTLQRLFDVDLCEHITNSIEHRLMLPYYLAMGFERSKFLKDYRLNKAQSGILLQIKRYYKIDAYYNISAVRNFIGKYFAFTCDPNPDFNYQAELDFLQSIDPLLYKLMEDYLKLWEDYDFTNDEEGIYRAHHFSFFDGLVIWSDDKLFID
jgi:hypothetical protein